MILFCVFCLISFSVVNKCDGQEVEPIDPELETEDPNIDTNNVTTKGPDIDGGAPPSPDTVTTEGPDIDDGAPPSPDTSTGNDGTPPRNSSSVGLELLQFLNEARKGEGSLENLSWADELGLEAQNLADTCVKTHEKYNFNGILTYVNKPESEFSAKTVVNNWFKKKANIKDGDSSACCSESSTSCCRYTKMMSPNFKSAGCGYKFCSNLKLGSKLYPNRHAAICLFREK